LIFRLSVVAEWREYPIQDETLASLVQPPGAAASLAIGPFDSHALPVASILLLFVGVFCCATSVLMIKASRLHPISVAFAALVHLRTLRPKVMKCKASIVAGKNVLTGCCSGLISLSRYLRKRPETFFAEKPDPAKAVLVLIPNAAVGCWIIDERDSVRCLAL
jgi:hypothetical protein